MDVPLLFFSSHYHDLNNSMQTGVETVESFKERMKDKYQCVEYTAPHAILEMR